MRKEFLIKDFGMDLKRKSTWGKEKATLLFKMRKAGVTMEEIYKTFPDKKISSINSKIRLMGFSAVDK